MEPTEILPSELWFHVYDHLRSPDLLPLWKTNTYFHDSLTTKLRKLKRQEYGIDLINDVTQQTSILTTYRLIDGPNNLLLPDTYHLRFDVTCDIPIGDHMFLLYGETRLITYSHKVFIHRGALFGLDNCILRSSDFNFIYLQSTHITFNIENISELPMHNDNAGSPLDCVFIFHAMRGNSNIRDCKFDFAIAEEIDGQWKVKPLVTPREGVIINWDPSTQTHTVRPIVL